MRIPERIKRLIPRKRKPTGLRPTVPTAALPLFVVAIAFTAFGLGLVFQASRFESTPSYGNLLLIMPAWAWGAIHLISAAVMFASIRWRTLRAVAVTAHTFGIILVGVWLIAFIVRYATDNSTTIVNVVNWAVLLFLVIRSSVELDQWVEPRPPMSAAL